MPNVNSLLDDHVVLKYEFADRIFLNGYVSRLQTPDDLAWFLCQHQRQRFPRYELLGEMTRTLVAAIEALATKGGLPVVHFEKRQSKEAVAQPFFQAAAQAQHEAVVLIGIAQESVSVFRPPSHQQRQAQKFAAGRAKAFVKQVYFYIWDRDFDPSFIKFNAYAPFQVRVWLNGHQWLRQHLQRSHHAYEPLDNGIAAVDDPVALDRLCRRFTAAHIQRFFDRWLYRLPNPFTPHDRRAGYTYQLSLG